MFSLVRKLDNCSLQPAWTTDANIPLSKEEIEDVLIDLANKFGFQKGAQSFHLFHSPLIVSRLLAKRL